MTTTLRTATSPESPQPVPLPHSTNHGCPPEFVPDPSPPTSGHHQLVRPGDRTNPTAPVRTATNTNPQQTKALQRLVRNWRILDRRLWLPDIRTRRPAATPTPPRPHAPVLQPQQASHHLSPISTASKRQPTGPTSDPALNQVHASTAASRCLPLAGKGARPRATRPATHRVLSQAPVSVRVAPLRPQSARHLLPPSTTSPQRTTRQAGTEPLAPEGSPSARPPSPPLPNRFPPPRQATP